MTPKPTLSFPQRLVQARRFIEESLATHIAAEPKGCTAEFLRMAMQAPGKRLRPVATLLAGEALGASRERLLPFALAVELVHTSSLILDDLPCMDDSDLRRGQPTLHTRVGDADAILCAFAMLARAFQLVTQVPEGRRQTGLARRLVGILEEAVGFRGMCEGQSLDLAFEKNSSAAAAQETGAQETRGKGDRASRPGGSTSPASGAADIDPLRGLEQLERIHRLKTGALFGAALGGAGEIAAASEEEKMALFLFGKNLGLAFQVADDVLDATGNRELLGKPVGMDNDRRQTFVSMFGLEASRAVLRDLHRTAREALSPLGARGASLIELADFLESRDA